MRYTILVFLISHSCFSMANCDFSGTVHSKEKQQELEELYNYTCEWFADTFKISYDPAIILENVFYVNSWDEVDPLGKEDLQKLWGYFSMDLSEKGNNNIYLINSTDDTPFENSDFVAKSFLFHELIHFFVKKSSFETIKNARFNEGMHETIAYWSQNQYVEMITDNTLIDYLKNKKEKCEISELFTRMATTFFGANVNKFICQAIHFLDEHRLEKFNNITNGWYQETILTGGFGGTKHRH